VTTTKINKEKGGQFLSILVYTSPFHIEIRKKTGKPIKLRKPEKK